MKTHDRMPALPGVDIDKNKLRRSDAVAEFRQFRTLFDIPENEPLADLDASACGNVSRTRRIVIAFLISTLLAARWYDRAMRRSILVRWGYAGLSFAVMLFLPLIMWKYGDFSQTGSTMSGMAALLTGVLAIQQFFAGWLDNHRRFGGFWQARSALRDIVYSLETKWADRATVRASNDTTLRLTPDFIDDLVATTSAARLIVRQEQQSFFDTYMVPTPDVLSTLGGVQSTLAQLSKRFGPATPPLAAEGSGSPQSPPGNEIVSAPWTTAHFTIAASSSLGAQGASLVTALAGTCEADLNLLAGCFRNVTVPAHFDVSIVPGDEDADCGAVHEACSGTVITVTVTTTYMSLALVRQMIAAEIVEVLAFRADVWHCQRSSGEGLSRAMASALHPVQLPPNLLSVTAWLNSGRGDFVSQEVPIPTDKRPNLVGCAVLFINWLHSGLGYSWQDITSSGGSCLADVYGALKGAAATPDAFHEFLAAVNNIYPPGRNVTVTDEDPFARTTLRV